MNKLIPLVLASLTGWLSVCAQAAPAQPQPAAQTQCERPSRLRFSIIPLGDSQDKQGAFKPLIEDLQQTLHIPVDLVAASSYGAIIEGLLSGAIDLARMGPASYITASNSDRKIVPFAAFVRDRDLFNDGNPAGYYSVLITRQDSAIKSWQDMKGRKLSLSDPESTSGATIPRYYFSRLIDSTFERFFARIGYAGNHEQSIYAVRDKEVDAAFVSSNILSALVLSKKIREQDIRILWKSKPIPHAPFVYRTQLCPEITQKIRSVFFNPKSPNLAATLKNLEAQSFAPVTEQDYQILRELPK